MDELKLPEKSGTYRYIVIQIKDELELAIGNSRDSYGDISNVFLRDIKGISSDASLENVQFKEIGKGLLDWDYDKEMITFNKENNYTPPSRSTIDDLMRGVDLRYFMTLHN